MNRTLRKVGFNVLGFLDWIQKNPVKAIILLLFIALSLFLKFHEVNTGLGDEFPGSDPWAYSINAAKFVDTGVFPVGPFNPLEILYLAFIYMLFGVHQFIARFIQIIFSFLLAYFLFRITKKYFGSEAGFIAALLALVEPNLVYYSAHLWDMFWVIFFLSLTIYIFVMNLDREKVSKWAFFWLGIVGAVGALGKLWVGAAAIVLMIFLVINQNRNRINLGLLTKQYFSVLVFFGGLLIIILSWSLYVSLLAGFPTMINSNSNLNFYLGNNPRGSIAMESIYDYSYANSTVIEQGVCGNLMYNGADPKQPYYLSKCLGKYTRNYIVENPGKFVKKIYLLTTKYWLYPNLEWYQRQIRTPQLRLTVMWALFALALIGFVVSLFKFWKFLPFYLIILGIWLSFAITVFLGRYKSSVAPFTVFFAAAGIYTILYFFGVYGKKEKAEKREHA